MGALRGHANSQDPSGSLSAFPKLAMQDPFIHCLSGFQTSPSLTTKSQNHFRSSNSLLTSLAGLVAVPPNVAQSIQLHLGLAELARMGKNRLA